jgi:hypothetical protein
MFKPLLSMGLTRLCGGTFVWDYKWEDRYNPLSLCLNYFLFS